MTSPSLDPNTIALVVRVIANTLRDARDPTLSENAKTIRTDIVSTAMQYYRSLVIGESYRKLLEALEDPTNDCPVEFMLLRFVDFSETDSRQLRTHLKNMYEEFCNDQRKSTST